MIWRVGAIVIAGIVALPLLGVTSSLFTPQGELWRHLADTQLIDIFFNTLVLLLVVGLGTTIIGAGTAWLVTMCSFPGSRMLQWALLLPLVLPTYIIGYAYADLLTFAGPVQGALRQATGWSRGDYWFPDLGSAGGVALLFTLVLYPYVYLAARTAFLSQSHALIEASRILGHGPWRTFFGVALPLARPAVAAGVVLALLEALADFGTVQYYGVQTLTTAIYRTWYGLGNREGAAQIAWRSGAVAIDSHFLRDAANSLSLAAAAAAIIVVLALFLSYAGRLVRRRALNRLIEFSALGYAIPGAVIAVGILLPLALADHGIDRLSRAVLGLPSGLLLSGTAFALLLAYTVRFLAVGLANIAPGLAAIDPAMDASARVLGARPREVLRRIHLPLLRGPMLTAAVVAFVEVMKELPATLLIRPFNLDTLAIGVYRFASDERLAQAAMGSIVIVMVSLAPVIVLSRAIAARRRE